MTIHQIRDYIKNLSSTNSLAVSELYGKCAILEDVLLQLEKDTRKGAGELRRFASRVLKSQRRKLRRWQQMLIHETALYETGYHFIAGVDEAGRGPLAGPVVAAGVILHRDVFIPDIDDSKKLSESHRESLYEEILRKAAGYGVGIISRETIDHVNILRASLEAMKLAVLRLPIEPDLLLVDGLHLPDVDLPMKALPHGDSLSLSIAAASIVAKVTRDRIMRKLDRIYPQYGFSRNKGYPTAQHLAALDAFGPCRIHRRSFGPVTERLHQPEIPLVNPARDP